MSSNLAYVPEVRSFVLYATDIKRPSVDPALIVISAGFIKEGAR